MFTKINTKQIIDLNIDTKSKTIKLLEDNIGENLDGPLKTTSKTQPMKERLDEMTFLNLKMRYQYIPTRMPKIQKSDGTNAGENV